MAIGQAYGFFACSKSKEEVEAEIPQMRKQEGVKIPSALELTVFEGARNLPQEDEAIRRIAEGMENEAGTNYILRARLPSATNLKTGRELNDLLNLTYASPLFEQGEPFRAFVTYEDENGNRQWLEE